MLRGIRRNRFWHLAHLIKRSDCTITVLIPHRLRILWKQMETQKCWPSFTIRRFRLGTPKRFVQLLGLPLGKLWPLHLLTLTSVYGLKMKAEGVSVKAGNGNVWVCWKVMRRNARALRTQVQELSWQAAVEIRPYGYGKVSIVLVHE